MGSIPRPDERPKRLGVRRTKENFGNITTCCLPSAPKAAPDDLKQYAVQVGLNRDEFNRCLSQDGDHQAIVQHDMDEGSRLGVSGTPAFFINGRPSTARSRWRSLCR